MGNKIDLYCHEKDIKKIKDLKHDFIETLIHSNISYTICSKLSGVLNVVIKEIKEANNPCIDVMCSDCPKTHKVTQSVRDFHKQEKIICPECQSKKNKAKLKIYHKMTWQEQNKASLLSGKALKDLY